MFKLIKYIGAFLFLFLLLGASFYTAKYLLKNTNLSLSIDENNKEEYKEKEYVLPLESRLHEGTWLVWPHKYTYGEEYLNDVESVWVNIVSALNKSEDVYIIAYNEDEKNRIMEVLLKNNIDMSKIFFTLAKTDDVFIRDFASFFVLDEEDNVNVLDFSYNAWGQKSLYKFDSQILKYIADERAYEYVDVANINLEGGAVESDYNGSILVSKSSLKNSYKNTDFSFEDIETYLKKYLGAKNIIYLNGVVGKDITDSQIEKLARFYDSETILTYSREDYSSLYEGAEADYDILINAKNIKGQNYRLLEIPLTKNNIGNNRASYLNFYVANKVVLVPIYEDENDSKALEIISELYSDREIIPVNVKKLNEYDITLRSVLLAELAKAVG